VEIEWLSKREVPSLDWWWFGSSWCSVVTPVIIGKRNHDTAKTETETDLFLEPTLVDDGDGSTAYLRKV
jgi:hypothetical protein